MKRGLIFLAAWALTAVLAGAQKPVIAQASLKVGRQAPGFTPLSDMNRDVMIQYGNLEWARRATLVIDKQGAIQHIDEGRDPVDPNTGVTFCTTMDSKAKS